MATLFINGKFAAQRTTGVQRLAWALVQALDQALTERGTTDRWILLCPSGTRVPVLHTIVVRAAGSRRFGLHAWEQILLPLLTFGKTLLNLSGPAPLLKRRQACMLPDAAVFDQPQAYTPVFGAWYRLLFRRLGRSASLLMTISEFSRQRLALVLKLEATVIQVVHCAATHMNDVQGDPSACERFGVAGAPYLLAVGSLNPTKNLSALVEAFKTLPDQNLRLVLVGGRNDAVFATQSATTDDPRIVRTGTIGDGELKTLYANALAFVFPSLYEGFGLPLLEAMSLGCPVIASCAASIPEVCADAATYFDPASTAEIGAAIRRVVDDAELRAQLSERGFERFKAFTWQEAGSILLGHLERAGLAQRSRV